MNSVLEDERNAHAEIDQYEDYMVELFLDAAKGVSNASVAAFRTLTPISAKEADGAEAANVQNNRQDA